MSALPPKADILTEVEKGPLMTQSGHSGCPSQGFDFLIPLIVVD